MPLATKASVLRWRYKLPSTTAVNPRACAITTRKLMSVQWISTWKGIKLDRLQPPCYSKRKSYPRKVLTQRKHERGKKWSPVKLSRLCTMTQPTQFYSVQPFQLYTDHFLFSWEVDNLNTLTLFTLEHKNKTEGRRGGKK